MVLTKIDQIRTFLIWCVTFCAEYISWLYQHLSMYYAKRAQLLTLSWFVVGPTQAGLTRLWTSEGRVSVLAWHLFIAVFLSPLARYTGSVLDHPVPPLIQHRLGQWYYVLLWIDKYLKIFYWFDIPIVYCIFYSTIKKITLHLFLFLLFLVL